MSKKTKDIHPDGPIGSHEPYRGDGDGPRPGQSPDERSLFRKWWDGLAGWTERGLG